jgi:hypothetical protein
MPIKIEKKCSICKATQKDAKLAKRLFATKFYVKGGESLLNVSRETGLSYRGLINHCSYHQMLDATQLAAAKIKRMAKEQTAEVLRKQVRTMDLRQELLDMGYEKLMAGEFDEQMDLKTLLTAAKDQDFRELKMGDQGIDFMKLMAGMRSGELMSGAPLIEASEESAGDFDPWSEEPADAE